MSVKRQKQDFMHRMHMMMFKILLIFGIPAGIAYGVGQWLDGKYFEGRNGSMLALGVAFVLSWSITLYLYSKLEKERREIELKEEEEREQKQKEIQQKLQQPE